MAYLGLLLNWLATHLVSFGFLVFLLLGFYFREPIFGNTVGSTGPSVSQHLGAVASNPASQEVAGASRAGEESSSAVDSPTTIGQTGSVPVSEGGSDAVDPVFRPANTSSVSFPSKGDKSDSQFRDPEREPVAVRQDKEKRIQRRLLASGRNAFSREDFGSAEKHYLRYLSERPEDPEAFAELGNLYRVTGRAEDALDAYYEAAVRFRDLKEWGEVQQLAGILDRAGDSRGAYLLRLPR